MHTADKHAPTPRTRGWYCEREQERLRTRCAGCDCAAGEMERELSAIREALTGEDYASLPSDIPTVRMAHDIRSDRDKFLQQVRDTCSRAEKAERELSAAKAEAERLRKALKHELVALNIVLTRQRDGDVCRVSVSDLLQGIRMLEQALAATRKDSSNG